VQPPKNGWTIVRKSDDRRQNVDERIGAKDEEDGGDLDLESDMIMGDLEPEIAADTTATTKLKQDQGSIRDDVDEIVTGTLVHFISFSTPLIQQLDPLYGVRHRSNKRADTTSHSPIVPSMQNEKAEKLRRERSIRTNRRHKFIDCLSSQDVNIGAPCLSASVLPKLSIV
jgi:hypothetical protein